MSRLELEELVVELTNQVRSRYYGKYRGIVEKVDDPKKLGRIIAKVPEIYGKKNSPWALPSVPFAGKNYGFIMLPKKGDGVWIEFEAGDICRPIWAGFWWAKNEFPEQAGADTRIVLTPEGHKFVLDDDKKEIHLFHSSGSEIKMTDNEILLQVGSSKIVISSDTVDINDGALVVK